MQRSYKDPSTPDEAIAIIKDVAGSQLDAELVDIFVNIPMKELIACTPFNSENNEI